MSGIYVFIQRYILQKRALDKRYQSDVPNMLYLNYIAIIVVLYGFGLCLNVDCAFQSCIPWRHRTDGGIEGGWSQFECF